MSAIDVRRLETFEAVIQQGLSTFVDVGNALLRIRDERLYRESHDTFEDYCKARWGFGERRARQLISAAEIGTIVPGVATESQARELSGLDADTATEVMTRAVESGRVTATAIRDARREVTNPDAQDLTNNLAAHDAEYHARAAEIADDEPALTAAECEALADPADLDDTILTEQRWRAEDPTPSTDSILDVIDQHDPNAKGDRERANMRATYSRHVAAITGLTVLDPELVSSVISDTEANVLEGIARQITGWAAKVVAVKRRSGLSLVNGGRQ